MAPKNMGYTLRTNPVDIGWRCTMVHQQWQGRAEFPDGGSHPEMIELLSKKTHVHLPKFGLFWSSSMF